MNKNNISNIIRNSVDLAQAGFSGAEVDALLHLINERGKLKYRGELRGWHLIADKLSRNHSEIMDYISGHSFWADFGYSSGAVAIYRDEKQQELICIVGAFSETFS